MFRLSANKRDIRSLINPANTGFFLFVTNYIETYATET